jgi:hypothetical protein
MWSPFLAVVRRASLEYLDQRFDFIANEMPSLPSLGANRERCDHSLAGTSCPYLPDADTCCEANSILALEVPTHQTEQRMTDRPTLEFARHYLQGAFFLNDSQ